MDRRRFILAGPLVLAAGLKSGAALALPSGRASLRGRVVTVREKAWNTVGRAPDEKTAAGMIERAVRELSGAGTLKESWNAFLGHASVVGLKPNCLAGQGVCSSPQFVHALAQQLLDCLPSVQKIVIWERSDRELRRAGFEIVKKGRLQCLGNDSAGYGPDLVIHGAVGSLFSRTVSQTCDTLINLPVLKDHGIVGLSAGMKNYYGAVNNPNKYHPNRGDPYVADLNCAPLVREKNVLTICEAFTAQYEGGPAYRPDWSWPAGAVLASADPVALDRVCWRMVEEKRKAAGMPGLAEAGREPTYVLTAGDKIHDLGESDLKRIRETALD
jgi:uncharacterized protein (DUF362 family)